MPSFAEFEVEKWKWVTAFDKKFYPDHFEEALSHYRPFIERFRTLALKASDSCNLLRSIQEESNPARTQILRIFNRYVCPVTSVEISAKMAEDWKTKHGDGDPARNLLYDTITPSHPDDQSSKTYGTRPREKKPKKPKAEKPKTPRKPRKKRDTGSE